MGDNPNEFYDQLIYVNKGKNIDGAAIYNFNTLRKLRDGKNTMATTQIKNGIKAWKNKVPPLEIKSFERIILGKPTNVTFENNTISFNKINGAKFYIVYRSKDNIMFNTSEIVDIFGSNDDIVNWVEKEGGKFNYGIKGLSYSNTLGEGSVYNYKSSGKYLSLKIVSYSLYGLVFLLF